MGQDWSLFRPRTFTGFDADGRLYVTDGQAYRVDVHDRDGLVRSVRRTYSPRRIASADVVALRDAALHVIDTFSGIPEASRPQQRTWLGERINRQADLPIPAIMTPINGLLVSRDGSFWVQVSDESTMVQREVADMFGGFGRVPPYETSWDLYDSSGVFLGMVVLPARFRLEAVRGLEVVGVWTDELDVEYVVRYEVVQSG